MDDINVRLQLVMMQMVPFLMAIVFHEVGHAFVAKRHGDTTAQDLGRLTLNPVPHIHPIGTILFPMINMLTGIPFMFGWAKPVPINYNRLRPYRRGLFLVALAGPATNFILAFVSALIFVTLIDVLPKDFYLYEPFLEMTKMAIFINIALAIFNLIPLPPLDGSKMLESFLSLEATRKLEGMQSFSFIILLGLLWTGGLGYVLGGPVQTIAHGFVTFWAYVFQVLGVPVAT